MAAAAAMRCKHSPDGNIQWLRVKPRMAFFIVVNLLFAHNVS
jgi:hypothetical protein